MKNLRDIKRIRKNKYIKAYWKKEHKPYLVPKQNLTNMTLIKPFQAIRPELELITSSDVFFGEVKRNYPEFYKGGFFQKISSEGIYIYEMISTQKKRIGIICRMPVKDISNGKVIKHEHTLATKEQKMMLLTLERNAMVKPVLLTYPEVPLITELLKNFKNKSEPIFEIDFEEENEKHRIYAITNRKTILKLQQLFEKKVPHTYVADGHHRLATSTLLQKRSKKRNNPPESYNYFLCSLFSTKELEIHDYNRIVEFDNFSPMVLMALLSRKFNVQLLEKPRKPKNKHEIVMAQGDEWFSLCWRPKILKKYDSTIGLLDVNLLNKEVLANIFAVEDISTDRRVKYIEGPQGINGIKERLAGVENRAAFILPPVTWEEFLKITNSGVTLPPKSTWFEPRMKNGVIVYGY